MPEVGATARRTRTVAARDIELFTEITGDRNPLHYDADAAAATRFGGLIVQGGVTSGLLNAVVAEDRLPYTEPPFWYYPTRQSLGAALLKAGKPAEAEAVYRKDLEVYPHNGWSTFGLAQALEAQGKTDEANMEREHFKTMWQFADIELKGSRVQ